MSENNKCQIKEGKSELNKQFREAYDNLPLIKYTQVRDEICAVTFWKTSTFYNRLRGDRPIKPIEVALIQQVFRKYNVEVFTNNNQS